MVRTRTQYLRPVLGTVVVRWRYFWSRTSAELDLERAVGGITRRRLRYAFWCRLEALDQRNSTVVRPNGRRA